MVASPPTDEKVRNGLKTLLGALGGVILALLGVRSLSADTQTYGLLERVMGGDMMGSGVLGMLVGLLFWALIVALVAGGGSLAGYTDPGPLVLYLITWGLTSTTWRSYTGFWVTRSRWC